MQKPQSRQIILVIFLVVTAFFFLNEYLGKIELPTESRVNEKLAELKDIRQQLALAKQDVDIYNKSVDELQELTAPYWVPSNSAKIEQEIGNEISKLLRKAQVQATQKVDAAREKNGSFLQEVYVTIELRGTSMQAIVRFLEAFCTYRNAGKFIWENVKIGPDNSRAPKSVNMMVKFKVLSLNHDAMMMFGAEDAK